MHLYLVRHATAEEATSGQDDASRELTGRGVRRFRAAVRGMRELGWRFDRVLASPWARAARTAELLAPVADEPPVATELLCGPPRVELLALLAEDGDPDRCIALVGHQPWLAELAAWLAFGDPRQAEAFELKKGGVVWLAGTVVPAGMTLRGVMPPKLLRALA